MLFKCVMLILILLDLLRKEIMFKYFSTQGHTVESLLVLFLSCLLFRCDFLLNCVFKIDELYI